MSLGQEPYAIVGDREGTYLRVPLDDIRALDMADAFAYPSRMDGAAAYLEMDHPNRLQPAMSDAEFFLAEAAKHVPDPRVVHTPITMERSFVHGLGNYDPWFASNPIERHAKLSLYDGRPAMVTGISMEGDAPLVQIETDEADDDREYFQFELAQTTRYVAPPAAALDHALKTTSTPRP